MKNRKLILFFMILLLVSFGLPVLLEMNVTNASFQSTANVESSINVGSFTDNFIVKYYDGNTEITVNDFEFDKEYTVKVWNLSNLNCTFEINTEGTEINTFSTYVSVDVSANPNNNNISKIYNGKILSETNKKLIAVNSFTPSEEPLIFYFTISTKYVKMIIEQYPERINPDDISFKFKINIIAETIN